jgi:hydroxymethylglutaryl-CoA reductase
MGDVREPVYGTFHNEKERMMTKIGILTGGGDVPGLNPCIKAVVNRAIEEGHMKLLASGAAGVVCWR